MPDQELVRIIDQLTLRKLEYVREYLKSKGEARSGTRAVVRERLNRLVDRDDSVVDDLRSLLGELDAWGDQRLKVARFNLSDLQSFGTSEAVFQRIEEVGMSAFLDGEIDIEPPPTLTPMMISYREDDNLRLLELCAAKTRIIEVPDNLVPIITDDRYPGVIFKPYRQEIQKAIDFAEINLTNGDALFSTTLLKNATAYRAEFREMFELFESLIPLRLASPVELYDAVKNIPTLPQNEVRTPGKDKRTSSGGKITLRSNSLKYDLRLDPEIMSSDGATASTEGISCNCYWEPLNPLLESVHTHVYAPQAEISIMGQVREASVRHVLRRILEVN